MKARLLGVLMLAVVAGGCSSQPQQQYQGYETQAGYQQPDHSWFYYWMAYHATMGMYQPSVTYHVYVPPAGYPVTYRPWQAREYVRAPNGQFVRQPQVTPPRPAPGATPARTSGGFTPKPVMPMSSRTSGGFTAKPAPPPPTTRSSGGFSRPSTPSSSRSSGGFSSSRKR